MTDVPARATPREWVALAAISIPTLVVSIDMSVLHVALPQLAADLHTSNIQQLWIFDIYGFVLAGFLVIMSKIGDRIGRRKLLMLGAAAFAAASVLAAFSSSAEMLIAARALLGLAGSTLAPSALALISAIFKDPKQHATAVAVFITCLMGGGTLGPVVGGLLLEHFWWGSVFLIGVPPMVALLIVGRSLLPEYRNPQPGGLDPLSVLLSLLTVLPLIYGLKQIPDSGLRALPLASILIGLIAGVLFVRRQLTLASPLLDLRLFRNTTMSTALVIMLLGSTTMSGSMLFMSQFLQLVADLSPMQVGLAMVPSSVTVAVTSMVAPKFAQTLRPGLVIAAGLAVSIVGFIVLFQVSPQSSLIHLVGGFVLVAAGAGPFTSLCTVLVMGSSSEENAGSTSALSETGGEFGVAFGIATFGTIGLTIYSKVIDIPNAVPDEASAAAKHSLAEAVAAARSLPSETADALLASSRAAFTSGIHGVAVAGVLLLVGLLALAMYGLRESKPIGAEVHDPAETDAVNGEHVDATSDEQRA